jgi:hypothetical protein
MQINLTNFVLNHKIYKKESQATVAYLTFLQDLRGSSLGGEGRRGAGVDVLGNQA